MQVRILGPLEVWDDGRAVELGAGRQRALLALLALHSREIVATDRLIEELWGGSPPPTAWKALQNMVSSPSSNDRSRKASKASCPRASAIAATLWPRKRSFSWRALIEK